MALPSTVLDLPSILLPWVASRPDEPALLTPPGASRRVITWSRLLGAIADVRDRLRAAGLQPGDRIALIAPTCPEFMTEFFGAQAAGLVVVAINPLSTTREIDYLLEDSGARMVIAHPARSDAGAASAQAAGVPLHLIEELAEDGPQVRPVDGEVTFDATPRDGADLAVLLYTSGTTGRPKGAMLTVSNLLSTVQIVREMIDVQDGDRWATGLPLFHVFGLVTVTLSALTAGVPVTLFPRWDPRAFLDALREDRISIISGVPTMWMSVLAEASDGSGAEAPALRAVSSGGAAISGQVLRTFEERFGAPVVEGYGLTETSAVGTFNPIVGVRKQGSAGCATPRMEVRIIDLDGREVPAGVDGEICLRGPAIMAGYWNRPEATAEVLDAEGWFRTGDIGRLDEDGYLFIIDRMKDLILHGGYNVYPREVEEVLYEIPGVREAAVIGTPDEKYGQQVTAVIARTPGSDLDAAEVERVTREKLAAYKIPRIVEFVDELPKGPSGKILKRAIVLPGTVGD